MNKSLLILSLMFFFSLSFSDEIGEIRKMYKEALTEFGKGNITKAESNFIIISRNPKRDIKVYREFIAKSHYFLGEIYFLKEDFRKSITYYRVVLEKFQDEEIYEKALYKLGRTLIIADRLDEGIAVLEDFNRKYTTSNGASYYWLGRGYLKKGEKEKALSSYEKLLSLYPDSPFAYEVRETLATFGEIKKNDNKISNLKINPEIEREKEHRLKLDKKKELLKKISYLLEIKQRLLEIKLELLNQSIISKEEIDEK